MIRIFYIPFLVCFFLTLSCSQNKHDTRVEVTLPKHDSLYIFILAGQSNMAGRGNVEEEDTITNSRVFSIDSLNQFVLAKEPLHFYEPTLKGLDCGLSFGKEIVKQLDKSISVLLIPCAVGGSSIQQWIGDSTHRNVKLLSNFSEKVKFAEHYGTVKGILWHQGESNTKEELIVHYADDLNTLFSDFRTIVGNDSLPIFLGKIGAYAIPEEKSHRFALLNAAIEGYCNSHDNTYIIETADLTHRGDNLHFNSPSLRILGKRYAKKYLGIDSLH